MDGDTGVQAHVGYYLIDDGLEWLQHSLAPRHSLPAALGTWARRTPLVAYLAPIALIVAACTYGLVFASIADAFCGTGWPGWRRCCPWSPSASWELRW